MRSYGSDAYRTLTRSNRFVFSADGTVLFAAAWQEHYPNVLHAIDVATGAVTVGERVTGVAVVGDRAVAPLAADPATLAVFQGSELAFVRKLPARGPVTGIAAAGGTIAAVTREPEAVVVVDTDTWSVRHTDLPATPSCVYVVPDGSAVLVGTDRGTAGSVVVVPVGDDAAGRVLTGPRAPVRAVAGSTGHDLVVASAGTRLLGWSPALGSARPAKSRVLLAAKHPTHVVGVTPGGLVLVRVERHALTAVDPSTGVVAWSVEQYGTAVLHGDRVLSVHLGEIRELDPETGGVRHTWTAPGFADLEAVADDAVAATLGGTRVSLLRPGQPWPAPAGSGHDEPVLAVSWQPGGDRFASTGDDGRVFVWSRDRAEPLLALRPDRVTSDGLAVHLDAETVYTTFNNRVQRWAAGDGALIAASEPLRWSVTLVLPLPGTGLVLAATRVPRRSYGERYLLDERTLAIVDSTRVDRTLHSARWLADGRVELRGNLHTVLFDPATRAEVGGQVFTSGDYSREHHLLPERSLLVETHTMRRAHGAPTRGWLHATDLTTGTVLFDYAETEPMLGSAAVSSDGVLATPHADAIRLWELPSRRLLRELPVPGEVSRLWFHPDGSALLVGGRNGALHDLPLR
jgi:WD40 repeat protein